MSFVSLAFLLVNTVAFMAAGAWIALGLLRWRLFPKEFVLMAAIAAAGILGYILFFIYLTSPVVGKFTTGAFYIFGFALLGYLGWQVIARAGTRHLVLHYMLPPLVLMIGVAGIYGALTFSCRDNLSPAFLHRITDSCMLENKSSDNILPQIFANKLIAGQANVPAGDWNLADRTPLQIGMVVGLIDYVKSGRDGTFAYEYTGIFLQLSWIAALWSLLLYLRAKKRTTFWVLWLTIFSGFFYYNSVFVWPKLYAASFVVTAIAILVLGPHIGSKRPSLGYLCSAAVFIVLGYLAHPGVIFTLLGLTAFLVVRWKLWRINNQYWRPVLIAAAVGIVVMAPWQIYKTTTTHSDRLMKMHLAGAGEADNLGTLQAIIESYSKLTPLKWAQAKLANTKTLFLPDKSIPSLRQTFLTFSDLPKYNLNERADQKPLLFYSAKIRLNEFYFTFIGIGVLNVGWFILLFKPSKIRDMPYIRPMLNISGLSLLFYVLLMFTPGDTVIHQGSYATMVLLYAVAAFAITQGPRYLAWLAGLIQVSWFGIIWVLSLYLQYGYSWMRPAALLVASVITFLAGFVLASRLTVYPADDETHKSKGVAA